MTDLDSRVARLEQKNEQYDLELRQINDRVGALDRERLQPMHQTLSSLDKRMEGHKNFLAGMLFAITGFWGAVLFALRELWIYFSGGPPT